MKTSSVCHALRIYVAFASLQVTTVAVFAAQYELVKGKGVKVCEIYKSTLNASHPLEPLTCERVVRQDYSDLKIPKWERIDLWENRALYWDIRQFLEGRENLGVMTKEEEGWINRRSRLALSPHLFVAVIDIENNGKRENVLMYKNGICGQAEKTYATALFVRKGSGQTIDRGKTQLLLQNTDRNRKTGEVVSAPLNYVYNTYGVFEYDKAVYFDRVDGRAMSRDGLSVYTIENGTAKLVCEMHFQGRDDGEEK